MFRLAALACLAAALTAADLQSLAWLAGRWVNDDKGTLSEEIWSPPSGDAMMGTWRMVAGGKTRIYELLVLKQREPMASSSCSVTSIPRSACAPAKKTARCASS